MSTLNKSKLVKKDSMTSDSGILNIIFGLSRGDNKDYQEQENVEGTNLIFESPDYNWQVNQAEPQIILCQSIILDKEYQTDFVGKQQKSSVKPKQKEGLSLLGEIFSFGFERQKERQKEKEKKIENTPNKLLRINSTQSQSLSSFEKSLLQKPNQPEFNQSVLSVFQQYALSDQFVKSNIFSENEKQKASNELTPQEDAFKILGNAFASAFTNNESSHSIKSQMGNSSSTPKKTLIMSEDSCMNKKKTSKKQDPQFLKALMFLTQQIDKLTGPEPIKEQKQEENQQQVDFKSKTIFIQGNKNAVEQKKDLMQKQPVAIIPVTQKQQQTKKQKLQQSILDCSYEVSQILSAELHKQVEINRSIHFQPVIFPLIAQLSRIEQSQVINRLSQSSFNNQSNHFQQRKNILQCAISTIRRKKSTKPQNSMVTTQQNKVLQNSSTLFLKKKISNYYEVNSPIDSENQQAQIKTMLGSLTGQGKLPQVQNQKNDKPKQNRANLNQNTQIEGQDNVFITAYQTVKEVLLNLKAFQGIYTVRINGESIRSLNDLEIFLQKRDPQMNKQIMKKIAIQLIPNNQTISPVSKQVYLNDLTHTSMLKTRNLLGNDIKQSKNRQRRFSEQVDSTQVTFQRTKQQQTNFNMSRNPAKLAEYDSFLDKHQINSKILINQTKLLTPFHNHERNASQNIHLQYASNPSFSSKQSKDYNGLRPAIIKPTKSIAPSNEYQQMNKHQQRDDFQKQFESKRVNEQLNYLRKKVNFLENKIIESKFIGRQSISDGDHSATLIRNNQTDKSVSYIDHKMTEMFEKLMHNLTDSLVMRTSVSESSPWIVKKQSLSTSINKNLLSKKTKINTKNYISDKNILSSSISLSSSPILKEYGLKNQKIPSFQDLDQQKSSQATKSEAIFQIKDNGGKLSEQKVQDIINQVTEQAGEDYLDSKQLSQSINFESINDYFTLQSLLPFDPSQLPSDKILTKQPFSYGKTVFSLMGVPQSLCLNITLQKFKGFLQFSISSLYNLLCYNSSGRLYFGPLNSQGLITGKGIDYFPNKYLYYGGFWQGKRRGQAILKQYIQENNQVYVGNFISGVKQGKGKQIKQDGNLYQGTWSNNKKHGFGSLISNDGTIYEGTFHQDQQTGYGQKIYPDQEIYKGQFKNNLFDGRGLYCWKNGSSYEGNFSKGKRTGKGLWRSSQHQDAYIYEGDYFNDKKNGFGIYKWPDGTRYQGQFKDDKKHGYGKIIYPDEKVNNYEWKQDIKIKKIDQTSTKVSRNFSSQGIRLRAESFDSKSDKKDSSIKMTKSRNISQSSNKNISTKNIVKSQQFINAAQLVDSLRFYSKKNINPMSYKISGMSQKLSKKNNPLLLSSKKTESKKGENIFKSFK